MEKLKRFLVVLLSFVLFITSVPITVTASQTTGNYGGGSQAGPGSGGGGYTDAYSVSDEKQGYRFTFVDTRTGAKVGRTVDILRSAIPADAWKWYTSAVEDYKEQKGGAYTAILYGEIAGQLKRIAGASYDENGIPWWFYDTNKSSSEGFKEWLLSDESMLNLSGINIFLESALDAVNMFESNNWFFGYTTSELKAMFSAAIEELRKIDMSNQDNINYIFTAIGAMETIHDDLNQAGGWSQDVYNMLSAFRGAFSETQ